MEIVYSADARTSLLQQGRTYKNPRFFGGVEKRATKVYIDGHWPKVEAAYRAANVPVEVHGVPEHTASVSLPAAVPQSLKPSETPEKTVIPEGWRDFAWIKLRALAQNFSQAPVLNPTQAQEAIEAEIARRAAESKA